MPHPKSAAGYRLGIVNPLTLVGNEIKTILRERDTERSGRETDRSGREIQR